MYQEGTKALFPLGRIVATQEVLNILETTKESLTDLLVRHQSGQWGQVDQKEREVNDWAADKSMPVVSVYRLKSGSSICIITEGDRRTTRVQTIFEWLAPAYTYCES
jgi:hypothetical protein